MPAVHRRRLALILAVVLTAAMVSPSAVAQVIEMHPPVAGQPPQMVVLLFDLSSTREARERAANLALEVTLEGQSRLRYGLGSGQVFRIATIGSSVEIVQDFTGDLNKITLALSRVALPAQTTVSGTARVAAMERMCDELARLPPSDSYFRDAPELQARLDVGLTARPDSTRRAVDYFIAESSVSPDEQRRIERACRQSNVSFGAVANTSVRAVIIGEMTAVVFDTATLTGVELERAKERAATLIDGLPNSTAVAIVTTGVAPVVLQPFTHDKSQVRAALARLTMPETRPDANTTVTSVRSYCAAMTREAQGSTNYVENPILFSLFSGRSKLFYLSTAVERGALASRDLFDVASTCTNANVSFYVLDGPWISPVYAPPSGAPAPAGFRQIGYDVGIGLSLAARQQDCPVALTTKQLELDSGYVSAIVRNESAKQVQRVTLGVVVTPNDDSLNVPRVLILPGPGTSLTPGQTFEMATRLADLDVLALLSRQGARAELGIVEVQFGDGTKWTYDLKGKGRFERK